ncbi:GPI ethanolamine phosphate transferase 3 [Hypsibius exemplaris]|uniref:GPI ethanolamine phosphate transferase 3 n=1 Tax=Hypsibius exemplaris TaxID=2072580 RepID=A0A1W0X476_HYPEX|nr:GPI ethanolamine phosphate transferase 3 [Hypsibius exemplaris]
MHDRHWWHCCSLLIFIILIACGIWSFSLGFLLSRIELHDKSPCIHNYTGSPSCYGNLRPTFQRAVIVVVDALRYDFLLTNPELSVRDVRTYENKIPEIDRLIRRNPENAALFKFIADPPTTTMQRIKGITTGSLPTFIDVSSNFAATSIEEDNFVTKTRDMGRNVTFMGDDTWVQLFPDTFTTSYPYPSFDVRDLDIVDNGVLEHLIPEIKKNTSTLLIAHMLGVDHCGHRYGRDHPEMARKLREVNLMIRSVVRELGDDTVLFVMGDHGMTKTGDHGGDSPDEVEAGLFVYSPTPFIDVQNLKPSVAQVDFAPTLSLLLGQPIPFSNLGQIIPAFFPAVETKTKRLISPLETALRINADQVHGFIQRYSTVSGSDLSAELRDHLSHLHHLTRQDKNGTFQRQNYEHFFATAFSSCQAIWARFDNRRMVFGVGVVGTSVVAITIFFLLTTGLHWTTDFITIFPVAVSIIHFFTMFSNSFQVQEDWAVSYVAQTFVCVHFITSYQRHKPSRWMILRTVTLLFLLRCLEYVRRCREEQSDCSVSVLSVNFGSLERGSVWYVVRWIVGLILPLGVGATFQLQEHRYIRPGLRSRCLKWAIFLTLVLALAYQGVFDKSADLEWRISVAAYAAVAFTYIHLICLPVFVQRPKPKVLPVPVTPPEKGRRSSSHSAHSADSKDYEVSTADDDEIYELQDAIQISLNLFAFPLIVLVALLLGDTWSFTTVTILILSRWHFACASPVMKVACWGVLAWLLFFFSGHQTSFPTIHWNSAFTGVGAGGVDNQVVQKILVTTETFSGQILAAVTMPCLMMGVDDGDVYWMQNPSLFYRSLWRNCLGYVAWHAAKLFFVMLNAAVNRRHLMVWKIFAPRYIFEVFAFGVTILVVLPAYLFAVRAFSATLRSVADLHVPLDQYTAKRTKEHHHTDRSSRKRR